MEEEHIAQGTDFLEEEEAQQLHPGREVLAWMFDEYERHARGPIWYAIAGLAALGLVVYSVITQNFLFAIIVIMFGVILGLMTFREPRKIEFIITDLGVGIDSKFFPYKEFKNFWVLYEPPEVKNIYLEFKQAIQPHLIVPLHDQDPLDVREILMRFLDEDASKNEEPFVDTIARMLKL